MNPAPAGPRCPHTALEGDGLTNWWAFTYDLGRPDNDTLIPEEFLNISDPNKERQTNWSKGGDTSGTLHLSLHRQQLTRLVCKDDANKDSPAPNTPPTLCPLTKEKCFRFMKIPSAIKSLYWGPFAVIVTRSLT